MRGRKGEGREAQLVGFREGRKSERRRDKVRVKGDKGNDDAEGEKVNDREYISKGRVRGE